MKGVLACSREICEIGFSIFAHQYVPFLPIKFNGNVVFEQPLVSSLKKDPDLHIISSLLPQSNVPFTP
jgi:hypothetical protein